jgi:hypothetical protein
LSLPTYSLQASIGGQRRRSTRATRTGNLGAGRRIVASGYDALVDDRVHNELILTDLVQAAADGRSPLLLTGRTDHLKYFEAELAGKVNNVFMLKGGMGQKQRRSIAEAIAAVPECEPRLILPAVT